MYLKEHKNGRFGIEVGGYLAELQVPKHTGSKVYFVAGNYDCLTIGEIIKAAGYDPKSILNRRLLITIEDEIQPAVEADAKCSAVFHKEEYFNGSTFCRVCGKRIRTA